MRLSENLYFGERAGKQRFDVLQGLRAGRFRPDVYVITLPENVGNVLDIYPSPVFLSSRVQKRDLPVLGLAITYREALAVVRQMVDDCYRETGGFSWQDGRAETV